MATIPMAATATALLLCSGTVLAADAAAGKTKAQQACGQCHDPGDWDGESPASLESLIRDVISGKVKHPKQKVALSDQEVANIAAFWAASSKGR